MISRVIKKTVDLDAVQKVDQLEGPLYQLEESGHTFEITCMSGGTAAAVSGTVSGRFLRADETTVYFTGTLSGNVASITLPQSCYNVNGRFGFVVFVSGNNVTSAIYAVAGNVYRSTSETIIDPTGEIPSLEELIAQIEACEDATDAATAAAAFIPDIIAPDYADLTFPVAYGSHCTHEGKYYRANTTIPSSEVWNSAHWDEVTVGQEMDILTNTANGRILSDEIKMALLACFQNVAWTSDDGKDYYNALESMLNPPAQLVSITAVYTQTMTVYTTDQLSVLRNDLVVTANYMDGTSSQIYGYLLTGTLTEGTSTITVAYGSKSTSFTVTVTDPALIYDLASPVTFTGVSSEMIDTGVVVFPTNRDATFLIDTTPASDIGASRFMFYTGQSSSPYNNVSIKAYKNSAVYGSHLRVESNSSANGYSLSNADYGDEVKIVLRYTASTNALEVVYKNASGVITTGSVTNPAVTSAGTNLRLGDFSSSSGYAYKGVISKFKVYKRVLSDNEIYEFLDSGV